MWHVRVLVGKLEGRLFWRNTRKCEDNIKTDLQEIGLGGLDRFVMVRDTVSLLALLNTIMSKISLLDEKILASQKRTLFHAAS